MELENGNGADEPLNERKRHWIEQGDWAGNWLAAAEAAGAVPVVGANSGSSSSRSSSRPQGNIEDLPQRYRHALSEMPVEALAGICEHLIQRPLHVRSLALAEDHVQFQQEEVAFDLKDVLAFCSTNCSMAMSTLYDDVWWMIMTGVVWAGDPRVALRLAEVTHNPKRPRRMLWRQRFKFFVRDLARMSSNKRYFMQDPRVQSTQPFWESRAAPSSAADSATTEGNGPVVASEPAEKLKAALSEEDRQSLIQLTEEDDEDAAKTFHEKVEEDEKLAEQEQQKEKKRKMLLMPRKLRKM